MILFSGAIYDLKINICTLDSLISEHVRLSFSQTFQVLVTNLMILKFSQNLNQEKVTMLNNI